jgi:Protein of unknown function (DUF3108)
MLLKLLWLLPLLGTASFAPQDGGGAPSGKEALAYNVEWRLITAGKARLERTAVRSGWQVNLHVESVGMVSKLFKVEDNYTALFNGAMCAESAQSVTHEGSRQREARITYDYETHKASYLERDRVKNSTILQTETEIPSCVHDIVGGIFFLRTLNLEPGQSIQVPVSDGKKSVSAKVEAQQHEDVKTPAGTFRATRYEIYVFNNVLFKRPAHLYVWLADDRTRLPVQIRVRMQFTIGTITLQLEKHE